MNWIVMAPLLTSLVALGIRFAGKDIGWLWVSLPLIGLSAALAGVIALAGLQVLPGIFGKLQMLVFFLALPVTTIATIVKIVRILI